MTPLTAQELLADHQTGHSELQIDSFILAESGCTAYGMYVQCLRELDSRQDTLEGMKDDIATQQKELRERELRLTATLKLQRDVQREHDRFLMHARALKAQVGELTTERRAALDDQMWIARITLNLAIEVFTNGIPSAGTLATILSLPKDMQTQILATIPNQKEATAWLQARPTHELPQAITTDAAALAQASTTCILPNGVSRKLPRTRSVNHGIPN